MTAIPSAASIPIWTVAGDQVARVAADASVADFAKALVARDLLGVISAYSVGADLGAGPA